MIMFKVYRGEDVAAEFERFEESGRPLWAQFWSGEGVEGFVPAGWRWSVMGWGDNTESKYFCEGTYETRDAARAAFVKKFKLT
jgi:hypothetical protein